MLTKRLVNLNLKETINVGKWYIKNLGSNYCIARMSKCTLHFYCKELRRQVCYVGNIELWGFCCIGQNSTNDL